MVLLSVCQCGYHKIFLTNVNNPTGCVTYYNGDRFWCPITSTETSMYNPYHQHNT